MKMVCRLGEVFYKLGGILKDWDQKQELKIQKIVNLLVPRFKLCEIGRPARNLRQRGLDQYEHRSKQGPLPVFCLVLAHFSLEPHSQIT